MMLNNIKKEISNTFKNNPYVLILPINDVNKLIVIYDYTQTDTTRLQRDIIPLLSNENYQNTIANLKKIEKTELVENIFSGAIIIYDYRDKVYYALNLNAIPKRNVAESTVDITISGPKDAFIENLDDNIAVIQKRLKTTKLNIKNYVIGDLTKTKVAMLYLDDFPNKKVIDFLDEKLKSADIVALLNIGQIEGLLAEKKALVPMLSYTARPDFVSESMIAHRVIILVDGIPLALVAPATFHFFIDYHDSLSENFFVILFDRFLFIISFFIAILLTPFILAIINYYPELLPIDLIATTINSRKGISFSFTSETVIAEIMFQTFRIAGTRLPRGLDSSLLVVGSFLIGRVVIDAGILSQESLYIAAFSVITSYVISNNSSFNTSVNLFRWFLIGCTILFGFVGLSIGLLMILIYIGSKESIFVPYLYPIAPFNFKELKKNIIPSNYLNKKNSKENKNEKSKSATTN